MLRELQADAVSKTLLGPIGTLQARIKELYTKVDERQVIRAEIGHYRDKVTRLANEGLGNVKAQAKAESNQEKYVPVRSGVSRPMACFVRAQDALFR